MTQKERILLLREAAALEQAGGFWTQAHAAVVAGYSTAFLRRSDCPSQYQEGNGPGGKERRVYIPSDVRAWMRARLRRAS